MREVFYEIWVAKLTLEPDLVLREVIHYRGRRLWCMFSDFSYNLDIYVDVSDGTVYTNFEEIFTKSNWRQASHERLGPRPIEREYLSSLVGGLPRAQQLACDLQEQIRLASVEVQERYQRLKKTVRRSGE